jgi:hypothetical protein
MEVASEDSDDCKSDCRQGPQNIEEEHRVIQVLQNSFLSAKESDITKFTVHE